MAVYILYSVTGCWKENTHCKCVRCWSWFECVTESTITAARSLTLVEQKVDQMKNAQFTVDEFLAVLRRRKIAFLLPAVLVIMVCGLGAFMLPKKYESSATILIQNDQVLNPLLSYSMALQMQPENRLGDYNTIIYSRPIIEGLMDSLGMQADMLTLPAKDHMIKQMADDIKTARMSYHSLKISYYDTVPARAQKGARVLSELFIRTKTSVQNRKNVLTVNFFKQKVVQLRKRFQQSQQALVAMLLQHIHQLPESDQSLYHEISNYSGKIQALETTMKNYHDALGILDSASKTAPGQHIDLSRLYLIPLLNVPYSKDLEKAVTKYDNLSQEYTEQYPDVQIARSSVLELVGLVKNAINAEETRKQEQILALEKMKHKTISAVQMAALAQSQDQDLKSNFDIYQNLYNEMKVKLEQARTSQDLGENSSRDYTIIDPPQLPLRPAKPNKKLIIGGGLGLAMILGLLSAGIVELFDTRIRTPQDVEVFEKPIIAYLPPPKSNPNR